MSRLDVREVVLNLLAASAPIRDPLRRLRGPAAPSHERIVEVALASARQRREFLGEDVIRGANILEIGSGRNACLGLLFVALGARRVVNLEIDGFGFVAEVPLYRLLVERAAAAGLPIGWPPAGMLGQRDGRIVLDPARVALHLGRTAASIPEPDAGMDVVLSLAGLEHVRVGAMAGLARELYRVTRPGGIGYHKIDLVDHYTRQRDPFRFLRYSESEYRWMYANRGSASNRFRMDDFERIFREAGFAEVRFEQVKRYEDAEAFERWRREFHPAFRDRPADMLRALDALMVVRR